MQKTTFGNPQQCDAVIMPGVTPCPNIATHKQIPEHIPGTNFVITYWCERHTGAK